MAGYTRQSTADIIPGETVKSAPINAEYNALRDAFAFSGGHNHDGSSDEGAYVGLIADTDGNNKVVVDTSNNRVSIYSEVSGAAVEQVRIQDGAIVPVTDDDIDLGAVGAEFKDLYIDGTANIDALISAAVTITGGNIDGTAIGGTTPAAGNFTTLTSTGTSTHATVDINGGNIDNTIVGATTAAAGTFTTVNASSVSTTGAMIATGGFQGTLTGGVVGDVTSSGTSTFADVDIDNITIDGNTISSTNTNGNIAVTPNGTGEVDISKVDIDSGTIDGTTIGGTTAAVGNFTNLTTTGTSTHATVDINGGAIDGTTIGSTTPTTIVGTTINGTTITASTAFSGDLTGNVTGNLTGDVEGDVTGDLTGNVTAASGSSTFNNVTINGTLDVTSTVISNVTDPVASQDAATKNYVDSQISDLIDGAPATLDTLNEIAAAINDDANLYTTLTASIATKLPLAGGTMTGAIAMDTSKITGLGDPTAAQDAATKTYVDTADAGKLSLTGGTMTGAIDMGSQKITTTYTPTDNADLTTKTYVDGILGSATAAATSAAAASDDADDAEKLAINPEDSQYTLSDGTTTGYSALHYAAKAEDSATAAAASYDNFDDRYLGPKSSAPSLDNDNEALIIGALYFDTTTDTMKVYGSGGWVAAGSSINGTATRLTYTAGTASGSYDGVSLTNYPVTYDAGYIDVYLNGVKLINGTDVTVSSGTEVVLATAASSGDLVDIVAYGVFELANFSINDANDVDTTGVADGQALIYDSGTSTFIPGAAGLSWSVKTADFTAVAQNGYFVDTSGGAVTVTLPSSPSVGDLVRIVDLSNAATNNITVARNGEVIQDNADDLLVATDNAAFGLIYSNGTHGWRLIEV